MADELYYPCIKDWATGEISNRVGPASSWEDAMLFLKQKYAASWEQANACPQPVSHKFFAGEAGRAKAK